MRSFAQSKRRLSPREMVLFSMLGALMFVSKIAFEFLPNIHLLGTLTTLYTVVYRKKALLPIYINVFLSGVWFGFSVWWIPYLYIWTVLWGAVMLLPKNMTPKVAFFVYPAVTALHGLLYGTLYAPAQAILFGLDLRGVITWILAGLYWDGVHAVGNFVTGFVVLPLSKVLLKLERKPSL